MWDLFINLSRFGDEWGEEAKKEGGGRYARRRYLVRDLVAQQVFKTRFLDLGETIGKPFY